MKKAVGFVAIVAWTLLCIYGTYNNTVTHAELIEVSESGYSIMYGNTGEVHSYE